MFYYYSFNDMRLLYNLLYKDEIFIQLLFMAAIFLLLVAKPLIG